MDELAALNARVVRCTLLLTAAGAACALLAGWKAAAGVLSGSLMCLAGYFLIVRWSASMTSGMANYCLRCVFYGAWLWLSLKAGLPVLALLAGITLQKGAAVLAAFTGKERERGSDQCH